MSVLGFVSPAVSPTNLLYNVVALPGGIYRYMREGRMTWPLAGCVIAGTLPGVFFGALVRTSWLADPRYAKTFVGLLLLHLGWRLFTARLTERRGVPAGARVKTVAFTLASVKYEFLGETYGFRPLSVFALALAVGVAGGIYGVGGGAIIAPFAVAVLGLPVYTIAGAAMCGTLVTSIAGVAFFEMLGTRADWMLGLLFGIGGLAGTYAGARVQRFLPERWIRLGLAALVTLIGVMYLTALFR
ncbi:MAG: sulfite exporter TauE/SafE family protein [Bryobacteraceae bacterium]